MFSQSQLAKMAGKRRITQETFDEAVQENIAEFDMDPEEALISAISEFEDQKVDLSNIIKTLKGGDVSGHPAVECLTRIEGAAASAAANTEFREACTDLVAMLEDPEGEGMVVLLHRKAVPSLLGILSSADTPVPTEGQLAALEVLTALLAARTHQTACLEAGGAVLLQETLAKPGDSLAIKTASLRAATALARKNEDGKVALLVAGVAAAVLPLLESMGTSEAEEEARSIAAACTLLTSLTSADDDTLPSSSAFANARSLGKQTLPVLLRVLSQQSQGGSDSVAAPLCTAIKQLSANEELCGIAAQHGALPTLLGLLPSQEFRPEEGVALAACAALRQLCSADDCKSQFFEQQGAIRRLDCALAEYLGVPAVSEQVLGLITNLTLRNPAASLALVEERSCMEGMLQSLQASHARIGGQARAAAATRQGCMAIRNMAVRCDEARTELLAAGAHDMLYGIRDAATPGPLQDAAVAALRDLGLDDYHAAT